MTVAATAKAMVVRSTKDDKADVMTTMITPTFLMMNMTNKMSEKMLKTFLACYLLSKYHPNHVGKG